MEPALAALTRHGGRLESARQAFPSAPQPWIDLSTGINPVPYPAPPATAEARGRLPYPQELAALEAAAAQAFGVADPARVAATPGSEVALRLLPHLLGVRRAAIIGPTYASHASAWSQGEMAEVPSLADAPPPAEAVVLVRPNNPDGRIVPRDDVLAQLPRRRFVIVDEAFVETTPEHSLSPIAGDEAARGLIVLRSFGKFYGLAGLRLGFVVAAPAITAAMRGLLGDWPVGADAIAAGLAAYPDQAWALATRVRLTAQSDDLDQLLIGAGFKIVGGTSLYRLARTPDAQQRFIRLAASGILTRPFTDQPDLLRFGLPGSQAARSRLAAALQATS